MVLLLLEVLVLSLPLERQGIVLISGTQVSVEEQNIHLFIEHACSLLTLDGLRERTLLLPHLEEVLGSVSGLQL
jgi:hypothetical protein